MKTAIVTGITGQDGAYLSELLLSEGWQVTGVMRRSSTDTTGRLVGIKSHPSFRAVTCDITDSSGMTRLIGDIKPDHLYLLAAQSHVAVSFTEPLATMQTDAVATMVALEAVRQMSPSTRVYFAATSELFGDTTESPQNEQTRLWPSSPYGIAKLASFHAVRLWREAYGLFAANGILFNHESPRRGLNFVTRKITRYVAQLAIARQNPTNGPFYALQLGNLHSRRDWGHAKDYVRAMHAMLCHDVPMDFVIATGQTRSIRDLLTAAFSVIGVHDWKPYVITDTQDCVRPQDVGLLLGDASLAKRILGWEPTISFGQMIGEMVENDIAELRAEERARVAT